MGRSQAHVFFTLGCSRGNQFGSQEPQPDPEIRRFAQAKGLSMDSNFHLMAKVDVNGAQADQAWVALKTATGTEKQDTRWNFETKFVVKCDDTECSVTRLSGVGTLEALRSVVPEVWLGARCGRCDTFPRDVGRWLHSKAREARRQEERVQVVQCEDLGLLANGLFHGKTAAAGQISWRVWKKRYEDAVRNGEIEGKPEATTPEAKSKKRDTEAQSGQKRRGRPRHDKGQAASSSKGEEKRSKRKSSTPPTLESFFQARRKVEAPEVSKPAPEKKQKTLAAFMKGSGSASSQAPCAGEVPKERLASYTNWAASMRGIWAALALLGRATSFEVHEALQKDDTCAEAGCDLSLAQLRGLQESVPQDPAAALETKAGLGVHEI
eukprot:g30796.t1